MSDAQENYKIQLDNYSGPLDLLLYLIKRDELDIFNIPIARVTQEYMEYMDIFTDLDVNVAGEFVVMAATLMEIKSRMMAPKPELGEDEEDSDDPRMELVRQLMEYKRFKEAALELNERASERGDRFTRPGERVKSEQPRGSTPLPGDLTLWTLLDAFSRVLEQTGRRGPHMVVMDETPQEMIIERLAERAERVGRMNFVDVFDGQSDRALVIGMFLALLELVKRQVLRVEQETSFGEIWLTFVPEEDRQVFETEPPDPDPADDAAPAAPGADADEWLETDAVGDDDDVFEAEEDDDIALPDVPEIEANPRPVSEDMT